MDIADFSTQFTGQMKELDEFVQGDDIKIIMGVEAVNHFKKSFQDEGFTDEELEKWPDVKRRNPESPWHGHSGQTGKFSQARTTAKVLSGETKELQNSISYSYIEGGVRITDATPYASVHNFGEGANVYGRKAFIMKKRQFMGKSKVLVDNIENKIVSEIKKILKLNS